MLSHCYLRVGKSDVDGAELKERIPCGDHGIKVLLEVGQKDLRRESIGIGALLLCPNEARAGGQERERQREGCNLRKFHCLLVGGHYSRYGVVSASK